jgi:hypothetical protein
MSQTSYSLDPGGVYAGDRFDVAEMYDAVSAPAAETLGFGILVEKQTDGTVRAYRGTGKIYGITMRHDAREGGAFAVGATAEYKQYEQVPVLRTGRIWVQFEAAADSVALAPANVWAPSSDSLSNAAKRGIFTTRAVSAVPGAEVVTPGKTNFWKVALSTDVLAAVEVDFSGASATNVSQVSDAPVRMVRGVVYSNVADLTAFTVAATDLTFVAGDRVLLTLQTTAAECGVYVVGTVATGVAALTRAADMATGATVATASRVLVQAGTLWAGSEWRATATNAVVGTTDPAFYPQNVRGILTLASGTKTLGATEGLFLLSTTRSTIHCTMNTPGGTLTLTNGYGSNSAGRTAGKSGTAAAIVIARVDAGTIDTANNSTVDFLVTNF